MNRFFSGLYTPGSTFKVITAACAIENIPDIYERTFTCKGKVPIGEGYVICNGTHGKVNFEKALNKSCNVAFAEIAYELGNEKMTATAERLGFNNTNIMVSEKIRSAKSKINLTEAAALDLGWAGIGQYTTLINPCQMLTIVSSIANNGIAPTPQLVNSIISPEGKITYSATEEALGEYFSQDTAAKLDDLLRSNVKNYYGDSYFPQMKMCGKTGTAEVSDSEDAKPNALFIGYSQNEKTPFAIIVVVEDTTVSMTSAVPIASKVMKAVKTEYAK
jgi:peptidoglycan glycosyltransferase